jgi:hypothetical protein
MGVFMHHKSILIIITFLACAVFADRRNFVWTYQYHTMPKGKTEFEFYQTTKVKESNEWEYRFEVEQGLTDHWDMSVYQIFNQKSGSPLSWDAVQLRTRYRFFEQDQWLLDPLLYLEYRRKLNFSSQNKAEVKIILAKTAAKFTSSIVPVYEFFFAPGDPKHEIGLDAGAAWEFHPAFSLGLESTTRAEFEDEGLETGSYLGPTVSFASGKWWYSIGAGLGITEHSDQARVRFLMGVKI